MKIIDISTKMYPDIVVSVDDEDFEILSKFKWHPIWNKTGHRFYAVRSIRVGTPKRVRQLYMHRAILGILDREIKVDHIDHNGLNNQRCNLRTGTHRQNMSNLRRKMEFSSTYTGVSWSKSELKWWACIRINGKTKGLGLFKDELDAANAYKSALASLLQE